MLQTSKTSLGVCLCLIAICRAFNAYALPLVHGDILCSNHDDRDDTCTSIGLVVANNRDFVTVDMISGGSNKQGAKSEMKKVIQYQRRETSMCAMSLESIAIETEDAETRKNVNLILDRVNEVQYALTERGLCWEYISCDDSYFGVATVDNNPVPHLNSFFRVFKQNEKQASFLKIRHEVVSDQPKNPVLPKSCVPHSQ